jgi:hypothetical protein
MEEDAGYEERADELRIRQAEQAWEFEVPAGFTTRPSGTPVTLGGPSSKSSAREDGKQDTASAKNTSRSIGTRAPSALDAIKATIARFFALR